MSVRRRHLLVVPHAALLDGAVVRDELEASPARATGAAPPVRPNRPAGPAFPAGRHGGIGAARQENGMNAISLSRGLGWFSVALGAAELLAGRRMARALGMEHRTPLVRLFGLRELLVGFGILARPSSPALLWARVGGDALDLAALAAEGLRAGNPRRTEVDIAMGMVAAVTALDILCGYRLRERETHRHRVSLESRARIAGAA